MDESLEFYVGRTFPSFQDFIDILNKRQAVTGEVFTKACGGLTIANANRNIRNEKRHFDKKFRYASAFFRCEREGIYTPKGKQRNRISIKMGCPVKLKLVTRRDRDCMEITRCEMNHNHDIIDTATLYKRSKKIPAHQRRKKHLAEARPSLEDALLLKDLPYIVTVAGAQDGLLDATTAVVKEEILDSNEAPDSEPNNPTLSLVDHNNYVDNRDDAENSSKPHKSQNSKESALSDIASMYRKVVDRVFSSDKSTEDRHYAFYVAGVLAKLPSDAKDWCQLEIQKILSRARSGTWKNDAYIVELQTSNESDSQTPGSGKDNVYVGESVMQT